MKKIFIVAFTTMIFGCDSGEKTTVEDTKENNQVGVPNANGNIPDTSNAINLSTQKKDPVQKDSLK